MYEDSGEYLTLILPTSSHMRLHREAHFQIHPLLFK